MPDPKRYTVTQVVETLRPDPNGRITPMTRVMFTMASGYAGMIEVTRAEATPDTIKALLDQEAARIEAIQAL